MPGAIQSDEPMPDATTGADHVQGIQPPGPRASKICAVSGLVSHPTTNATLEEIV
jgi:hypothetical protein